MPVEKREPFWITRGVFSIIGRQLGLHPPAVGKAWNDLMMIDARNNNPKVAEELWWFVHAHGPVPLRLGTLQTPEDRADITLVDAASLLFVAEQAELRMGMRRGKLELHEYLGINHVGAGTVQCWKTIAATALKG